MQHWTILLAWNTWQEFLDAGGTETGFRASRWKTVQKLQKGDLLLCYMIGISRYFAILEVTDKPFRDTHNPMLPCRVPVRIVMDLPPEFAVPVLALNQQLSFFKTGWSWHFRMSPIAETVTDAEIIMNALAEAQDNPTFLEYDRRRLERSRIPIYETKVGSVTIPESPAPEEIAPISTPRVSQKYALTHEEIQWRLLTLGSQMGMEIWVAKNDRIKIFNAQMFKDIPQVRETLPAQFDEATQRTIELIDVLWLKGNAIVAAFEVEHTSTVYSGLLRMSDLVSMHPNINIDLYIVAPDERREKVRTEINRPTFTQLKPPLKSICRFIPYSALVERLEQLGEMLRYVRPEFLDEIAETLEVDL